MFECSFVISFLISSYGIHTQLLHISSQTYINYYSGIENVTIRCRYYLEPCLRCTSGKGLFPSQHNEYKVWVFASAELDISLQTIHSLNREGKLSCARHEMMSILFFQTYKIACLNSFLENP